MGHWSGVFQEPLLRFVSHCLNIAVLGRSGAPYFAILH